MDVQRLTITRGQVAAKFGISEPTLLKRLPALEAAGFPRKLPGFNAWSAPAVDRWFATAGLPEPLQEPAPGGALAAARLELETRYAS